MKSAILTMIDDIRADRPRWKPDESATMRSWGSAFEKVDDGILIKATENFLKNGRGNPTIQKLWKEINPLQRRQACVDASPGTFWEEETKEERHARQRELDRVGDPIRGYLIRHGIIRPTQYEADVLGWAKHLPCLSNYDATPTYA